MIQSEDFSRIVNDVRDNVFVSPRDASMLVATIAALDGEVVRHQRALSVAMANAKSQMIELVRDACSTLQVEDEDVAVGLVEMAVDKFTAIENALFTFFSESYLEDGDSADSSE